MECQLYVTCVSYFSLLPISVSLSVYLLHFGLFETYMGLWGFQMGKLSLMTNTVVGTFELVRVLL